MVFFKEMSTYFDIELQDETPASVFLNYKVYSNFFTGEYRKGSTIKILIFGHRTEQSIQVRDGKFILNGKK